MSVGNVSLSESRRAPKTDLPLQSWTLGAEWLGMYISINLAPTVSNFLKRSVKNGTVEVTGQQVNRGAGFSLEMPCKYRLYGPEAYLDRIAPSISRPGNQNNAMKFITNPSVEVRALFAQKGYFVLP